MTNVVANHVNKRIIISCGVTLIIYLAALTLLCVGCHKPTPSEIRERARLIGVRHGILIGYGPPDTFFVPPDSVKYTRKITQVDINALPPALDGIERSLEAYPPGFVANLCKAIFLCGSMTLKDGSQSGGTYEKSWIILVASKKYGKRGTFEMAELGLHHEFSSLIWHRILVLQMHWSAQLPPGWKEAANPLKIHGLSTKPVDGFLSPYGATTAENDFNVYAEKIFTEPKTVAKLGDRQPIIAKKIALLMAAYERTDSRMAGVFDRLGFSRFRNTKSNPLDEPVTLHFAPPISMPAPEIVR